MDGQDEPTTSGQAPASGSFTARDVAAEQGSDTDAQELGGPAPPVGDLPREPEPRAQSRLRAWAPRIAVTLTVVAAVAAATVSFVHGNQWRERAERAAAFAEQETSRADTAEELLVSSEEDVRALEGRLAAVASDKEAARDQAQSVSIERDQFIALSAIAVQAADNLDTCVRSLYNGLNEAVRMWNTAVSTGYFADAGYLNSYLNTVDSNCSAAQQSNNQLRGVVDAFVGS